MDNIIREAKKKRQKRNYFTQETENAIVAYNTSNDKKFKSNIYSREIHYPFYKLTQNIIHTFKFYYTDGVENLEDLQHEIMVFLLDKIHLFDPSKGAKAYSYFGTIVKRWLIIYNQKNYKKRIESIDIGDISKHQNLDIGDNSIFILNEKLEQSSKHFTESDRNFGDELYTQGYKEGDRLSIFIDLYVKYMTENIYNYFPKEYDAQIADCILELFRKREAIDVFNKKALYIYIREMTDVDTPVITKVTKILKKQYKKLYTEYAETGYVRV